MRISVRQALLGLFLLGSSVLGQAQAGEPIRVLFVGNSYTFVNDLPAMVRQMSVDAGQSRPLDVKHVTFSGASLEEHWKRHDVQDELAKANYDYVVIQDHSMMPVKNPDLTRQYVRLIADLARKDGAQPILYLTWARQNNPTMQAQLDSVYTPLAKETGALLAPVGQAWQKALADQPQPGLFLPDGSHPSFTGTYLTASVFYALIYGTRPPLPAAGDKIKFDHADPADLQQDAWKALQSLDMALRTPPAKLNVASVQAKR